jgi:glycosyltransferase involved in cell wall biosynthesis
MQRPLGIICGAGYISGKEIVTLELALGLQESGFDIDVATTRWGNGEFAQRLHNCSIRSRPMWLGYISATPKLSELRMTADQVVHLPALYWSYRDFIRNVEPTKIIHTNWHHLLLLMPFLRCDRDLFWVHEIVPNKVQYRRLFAMFAGRLSDFVAVSDAVRRSIIDLGVPNRQVRVIHNGISPFEITNRPQDQSMIRIGIVGQIGAWKGHEDLIEAFALVAKRNPRAELHIFGTDTSGYAQTLRNLVGTHKLSDRVHWHGFEPDRSKIYSNLDVCVVPSRFHDPLPTAAIEAAMAGLPCVATRKGGLPEIVQDGVTGLLVEASRPSELAEAVEKLAINPRLRTGMGTAARQLALDRFNREHFVKEFANLLGK